MVNNLCHVIIFSSLSIFFAACSSDSNKSSEQGYLIGEKRIVVDENVGVNNKLPSFLEGYYFDYNNEVNSSAVVSRYNMSVENENILYQLINKLCSSEHLYKCSFLDEIQENNVTTMRYEISSDMLTMQDQTNLVLNNFFDTNISLESNSSMPILRTRLSVSLNDNQKDYWLISLVHSDVVDAYTLQQDSLYKSYINMLNGIVPGFIDTLYKGDTTNFSEELLVGKTWGALYENSQDSFSQCLEYDENGTGSLSKIVNDNKEVIPFYWSVEDEILTLKLTKDVNSSSNFSSEVYDVHTEYFMMKDQNKTWQQFEYEACQNHLKDLGN